MSELPLPEAHHKTERDLKAWRDTAASSRDRWKRRAEMFRGVIRHLRLHLDSAAAERDAMRRELKDIEKVLREVEAASVQVIPGDHLGDTLARKVVEAHARVQAELDLARAAYKKFQGYTDWSELRKRAEQAEAEVARVQADLEHERETALNDPAEQRAERYAQEAADLTTRLIAADASLAALHEAQRILIAEWKSEAQLTAASSRAFERANTLLQCANDLDAVRGRQASGGCPVD